MKPYSLQLVQPLKDADNPTHHEFYIDILDKSKDNGFDNRFVFSNVMQRHST